MWTWASGLLSSTLCNNVLLTLLWLSWHYNCFTWSEWKCHERNMGTFSLRSLVWFNIENHIVCSNNKFSPCLLCKYSVFVLETALNKLRGTTDVMMDIEEMRVHWNIFFKNITNCHNKSEWVLCSELIEDIKWFEWQIEQEHELREQKVSVARLLQIQALRIPLLISVVLQLGQQLSGIIAVSCILVLEYNVVYLLL